MTRDMISGANGYGVPCLYEVDGREETVCIVSHGFGSSKESTTAQMLLRALPKRGIGVLAFDFPAHGDSPVDGEMLRIATCMQALEAAERRVRSLAPRADIVYFSSSFGAYINFQYLALGKGRGEKSFFRSAAVNMPDLFAHPTEEERARLERDGFLTLEGYTRPIKLTTGFLEDLAGHDLFQCSPPEGTKIRMIHGEQDQTILLAHARRFAAQFHVPLAVIPGGDHSLSVPGAPERVLQLATEFFEGET
ncbi:MAG: alpha/beta hydrolase [Oscillospiraceae bacterium]|jgi:pimeloyl-ACP methyl ester carboxylesterase